MGLKLPECHELVVSLLVLSSLTPMNIISVPLQQQNRVYAALANKFIHHLPFLCTIYGPSPPAPQPCAPGKSLSKTGTGTAGDDMGKGAHYDNSFPGKKYLRVHGSGIYQRFLYDF